jgi:hypothetical protein
MSLSSGKLRLAKSSEAFPLDWMPNPQDLLARLSLHKTGVFGQSVQVLQIKAPKDVSFHWNNDYAAWK